LLDGQQVGGGDGGGGGGAGGVGGSGGGAGGDSNDSGQGKHVSWGVGVGAGAARQSRAEGNAGIAGAGFAGAVPLEGVLGLGTAHASVSQVL